MPFVKRMLIMLDSYRRIPYTLEKEMGFCQVKSYDSKGLLVSFFISIMSYRYILQFFLSFLGIPERVAPLDALRAKE